MIQMIIHLSEEKFDRTSRGDEMRIQLQILASQKLEQRNDELVDAEAESALSTDGV